MQERGFSLMMSWKEIKPAIKHPEQVLTLSIIMIKGGTTNNGVEMIVLPKSIKALEMMIQGENLSLGENLNTILSIIMIRKDGLIDFKMLDAFIPYNLEKLCSLVTKTNQIYIVTVSGCIIPLIDAELLWKKFSR